MLSEETVIQRAPGTLETDTSSDYVLLNAEGELLALNEIGEQVWLALTHPATFGELVARIAADFGIAPEQCAEDVRGFIEQMIERYVIEIPD